jgi:hypothetical protein
VRLTGPFEAHQARAHPRRRPPAVRVEDHLAPGACGSAAIARHALERLLRGQRTHEHALVEGHPGAQASEYSRQSLDEGLEDRAGDEEPRECGAALSGRGGDGHGGLGHREGEVGVFEHDHRVLSAHLESQDLARLIHGSFRERTSGRPRAREEHAVDVRMESERAPGVATPLHELHHARREPRLACELDQERAHRWPRVRARPGTRPPLEPAGSA